jgi:hypothetical protein
MWIDGYNGVAHHLTKNMDFAIAAALSCGSSTFKYEYAGSTIAYDAWRTSLGGVNATLKAASLKPLATPAPAPKVN